VIRFVVLMLLALLAGCGISKPPPGPAPVIDRSQTGSTAARTVRPRHVDPSDTRPETYTVKPGDRLYAIALDHGLDYRDLARWNRISNPDRIFAGQVLRLRGPDGGSAGGATPGVAAQPLETAPAPVGRSLDETPPVAAEAPSSPRPPPARQAPAPSAAPVPDPAAAAPAVAASPEPAAELPNEPPPAPQPAARETRPLALVGAPWQWPANGRVVAQFNEAANRKGIAIAGAAGDPVLASAAGEVVYAGDGLRGYGKLIVLRHNKEFLSAYAHNQKLLVKEGDVVKAGQKIAEMGSTDAADVRLHFEIRRFGKPLDPLGYLPGRGN